MQLGHFKLKGNWDNDRKKKKKIDIFWQIWAMFSQRSQNSMKMSPRLSKGLE